MYNDLKINDNSDKGCTTPIGEYWGIINIFFGARGGCNGFEYTLTPKNTRNVQDHHIEDIGVPIAVCSRSGFLVVGLK